MHSHDHALTAQQARALLAAQMPDLATLPLRRIGTSGTDHVIFRLGPALVARFPRLPHAAAQLAILTRWMPLLTQALTLATPMITRIGQPGPGYPFPWSVGPFLPGQDAFTAPPRQDQAAQDLAANLLALHALPLPPEAPDQQTSDRLDLRLAGLEHQIAALADDTPTAPLLRLLDQAHALPPPDQAPVWRHGDLHPLNLLTRRGRLAAVIDWGAMGVGDPANDLIPAWTLFDPPARAAFLTRMQATPATIARGRAFALSKALRAIHYYRHSNPPFRDAMRLTLARLMDGGD